MGERLTLVAAHPGSLDRARRPMTAGAAVGGLRRRAGAEPDFSLLSAATAAADDAILGAAPRKPEQPTVALCGSPLKALRARRRSSGPEASAAAPAAPAPDVWRADDAPTDDGAGAAVSTAVVEPPSTKPTAATARVDPMVVSRLPPPLSARAGQPTPHRPRESRHSTHPWRILKRSQRAGASPSRAHLLALHPRQR